MLQRYPRSVFMFRRVKRRSAGSMAHPFKIPKRRPRSGAVFICAFVASLLLFPRAHAQVRSPFTWLPSNFDTTANGNYRGARITSRSQLDSMRSVFGVRTIINLAKDALPKKGPGEIEWSKELGIEYVSVYLGDSPPSDRNWSKIRDLLSRGGVYLHCAHGADRTGAVIAKYRIEVEGVEPCDAYREARRFGFKPWLKKLRAWIGCPEGG